MSFKHATTAFAAFGLVLAGGVSHATILTFDAPDGVGDYDPIPETYGDNVTGTPEPDGWGYAEGNGWTPNIVADYDTEGAENHLEWWSTGYGDLEEVAFAARNGRLAYLTLTADVGWLVRLNSFDAAGYLGDYTNQTLRVEDGSGGVLVDYSPYTFVYTDASGATHTMEAPGVTAQSITLIWGTSWNTGLDNINFDQVRDPGQGVIPEPATLTLLGIGLAGLGYRRLRAQR